MAKVLKDLKMPDEATQIGSPQLYAYLIAWRNVSTTAIVDMLGEYPKVKLVIFSDGLDVDKITQLHQQFLGRCRVGFGWGTMLTNDFKGLVAGDALAPFSLVCKAVAANGRPTVKLSDNPNKAMGPASEVARYKRVFGVGDQQPLEVVV